MAHRPVKAEIKGAGLVSQHSGFTRLTINGAHHHPDDVARAVECHAIMLAALKKAEVICQTLLHELEMEMAHSVAESSQRDAANEALEAVQDAIARAEGRA